MLREAIGERLSEKTSSAKHKILKEYKNTKNVMGSWSSDTKVNTSKKLKNVRSKIDNFSLKRHKHKRSFSVEDDERPQTIAIGNDEMMQSLSFNSPLNNRSYNLENIPQEVATYEIPKSLNRRSSGDLPSYDDVLKDEDFLKRNTHLTQSLYSAIHKPNNLDKNRNISDSQLNTISSGSSDENDTEPPSMPAPELPEQVYGRIKKLPSTDYENAPMIPLRKPPPPPVKKVLNDSSDGSDQATICGSLSERSFTDLTAPIKSLNIADRSESWRYVDNISRDTSFSVESTEPIYANDENERIGASESPYGQMFEAKTILLTPQKISNPGDEERKSQSIARDILNEFDPLSRESFDAFIMNNINHLSLLETLLSEETYGSIDENYTVPDVEQIEEDSSVESVNAPMAPDRSDSLAVTTEPEEKQINVDQPGPAPKPPNRSKKVESRAPSVIIHQNLKLRGSVENLAEPFLAHIDDKPSTSGAVDLSRPKPAKTSWFVESESEKFVKNNLDNPNNFSHAPADKLTKSIPQLSKVNNLTANREQYLPTYEESKNDEIVNMGAVEKTPDTVKTSRSLFNFGLKRRSSLKENKLEEKDFIPRPQFSEDPPAHGDKSVILFKLPSGVIEDILKELNPRFVDVKRRQFKAYSDSEFKVLKESIDFNHLTSIQYLINHKFAEFKSESGRQIYCFELNLAVPKSSGSGVPSALLDNKGSPVKTQRVTYVYGIHSRSEKCLWMQKIIRSVTNVFPKEHTADFMRAGWCYMKVSH